MVDALSSFTIVTWLRPKDTWYESLRVAIVERKPARLDLDHDAVAWQEDMIRGGQSESVEQRNVGSNWLGCFQAFAIAAAEDVSRNHQLITAHIRLARDFVGIEIDYFNYPIGIRTAG